MGTRSTMPSARGSEDRLDSWKEIAAYFNRDVTTVQRWERREGMPVHRHLHDRMGSVYAFRTELQAWAHGRKTGAAQENGKVAAPPDPPVSLDNSAPQPQTSTLAGGRRWLVLLLAAFILLAAGAGVWFQRTEYFWRNPIADFRSHTITNFEGVKQAAAMSRDGHFIAFLADRDGPIDIWVTQVGSGEFHNLTRGTAPDMANLFLRALDFSPDGSMVTFWLRRQRGSSASDIGVWAVPTLGGQPKPYLEGVAEADWSPDGSRLAYHTPGPGDPLFVSKGGLEPGNRPIYTAPAGLHSHFPLWSKDGNYLYLVQGELPDKSDIWRIPSAGGNPERMTSHNAFVSYPVLLNRRTLLYLASDADGSGPWLYSMDVERRIAHRLTSRLDRFTSLAAADDGRRLVATLASTNTSLWRLRIDDSSAKATPAPIPLTTGAVSTPRLAQDFLLYVSANGTGESIWKFAKGTSTELWRGEDAQVFGVPAISPDGRWIAFSVSRQGQRLLYVMQADGAHARVVTSSLNLQGAPAWAPDGQSIATAVADHGIPRVYRVPIGGAVPTLLVSEYSTDPAWAPDGSFVVYTGRDIGTTFAVRAVTSDAKPRTLPPLQLTRGARHVAFLPGGNSLVVLRGDMQHKDLWLIDLKTGEERQLTHLPPDFDARDFDISPDGREVALERTVERSDVVMMDLPRP
jgi:Tol biopolymer transport system component